MKNILSIDGWYFKTFTKLANLMLLNLLFILLCIPIVTSGASFIALVKSIQELKIDCTLSAIKVFVSNFRANLSKGLILLGVEAMGLIVPGFFIYTMLKYVPILSTIIMILFSFLLLILTIFAFIYATNDVSVKEAVYKALKFVSLKIAYGIAAFVIPIVIIFVSVKYSIILLILIGFSLIISLQLYIIERGGVLNEND